MPYGKPVRFDRYLAGLALEKRNGGGAHAGRGKGDDFLEVVKYPGCQAARWNQFLEAVGVGKA